MSEGTNGGVVMSVTWHTHTDRGVRAAVGRDVPWWTFQERMVREVGFLMDSLWHLQGVPASELDGMVIRVDGILVGVVDSKGLDLIDGNDDNLIDWVWPSTFEDGGAVTVGQVVTAAKVGTV